MKKLHSPRGESEPTSTSTRKASKVYRDPLEKERQEMEGGLEEIHLGTEEEAREKMKKDMLKKEKDRLQREKELQILEEREKESKLQESKAEETLPKKLPQINDKKGEERFSLDLERSNATSTAVIKENKSGYLKKYGKPKELIQTAKQRWFVLDIKTNTLSYYEKPKQFSPIGVINLHTITNPVQLASKNEVSSSSNLGKEFLIYCFIGGGKSDRSSTYMAARKFVIIAPTNQEANEWVSAINACCSFKEDFKLSPRPESPRSTDLSKSKSNNEKHKTVEIEKKDVVIKPTVITMEDLQEEVQVLRKNLALISKLNMDHDQDNLKNKIKMDNLETEVQRLTILNEEMKSELEIIREKHKEELKKIKIENEKKIEILDEELKEEREIRIAEKEKYSNMINLLSLQKSKKKENSDEQEGDK